MGEQGVINVEEIMQGIRAEIKQKGYTLDMLSFQEKTSLRTTDSEGYSLENLKAAVEELSRFGHISSYHNIEDSGVKSILKKVIRKLMLFLINPIVEEQNRFNQSVTRSVQQMIEYIETEEKNSKGA